MNNLAGPKDNSPRMTKAEGSNTPLEKLDIKMVENQPIAYGSSASSVVASTKGLRKQRQAVKTKANELLNSINTIYSSEYGN